jgi:hypothetical protein
MSSGDVMEIAVRIVKIERYRETGGAICRRTKNVKVQEN